MILMTRSARRAPPKSRSGAAGLNIRQSSDGKLTLFVGMGGFGIGLGLVGGLGIGGSVWGLVGRFGIGALFSFGARGLKGEINFLYSYQGLCK